MAHTSDNYKRAGMAIPGICVLKRRTFMLLFLMQCVLSFHSMMSSAQTTTAASNTSNVNTTASPTLSQCQICGNGGSCAQAYKGNPGQFCGNWLDKASQRQSCCCPQDAVCYLQNFACNCKNKKNQGTSSNLFWIGFVALGAGLLIGGGAYMCMRKKRQQQHVDQPVYAQGGYAQQGYGPGYGPGGYGPGGYGPGGYGPGGYGPGGYGPGGYGRGGGMSAGAGAAVGAAAGLVGGLVIGDMIADAGDHGGGGGGGGGGDFGGGDFAGDF
jgi:hypothetical protein